MKKMIIVFLYIFLSLGTLVAEISPEVGKDVGVTFARNDKVQIAYFRDIEKKEPIDASKRQILPSGAQIYFNSSVISDSLYELTGFQITEYGDDGKPFKVTQTTTVLSGITIPINLATTEISIMPIGQYRLREIKLSDTIDGVELKGQWTINDTVYNSPVALINPHSSYYVSYRYDSSKYYFISGEPAKRIISADEGLVLYHVENPDTAYSQNLVHEYEVRLNSYTALAFNDKKNILAIERSNGEKLNLNELGLSRFKKGETLLITTKKDYRIDCVDTDIHELPLQKDSRVFSLTIRETSKANSLTIFVSKQQTKEIVFDFPEVANGKEPEITITLNDSIYEYKDIYEKKKLTMMEADTIYISVENPNRNTKLSLIVKGADPSLLPDFHEITDLQTFQYAYSDISEVRLGLEYGFRFTNILGNDNRLKVTYIADGRMIKPEQFLPVGTPVKIYIDAPDNLQSWGKNSTLGSNESEFVVGQDTTFDDFRIFAKEASGFFFDPSDFTYEHGEISFKVDGRIIKSRTFINAGKEITYAATSTEPGYRLPEKLNGNKILVQGEYETKKSLQAIRFAEAMKPLVYLPQPKYGGKLRYYYQGKEVLNESLNAFEGDEIQIQTEPLKWWDENPNYRKNYVITHDSEQTIPIKPDPFTEREDHKGQIKIVLDESVGKNLEVSIPQKDKVIIFKEPERLLGQSFLPKMKTEYDELITGIGTGEPLKVNISKYVLAKDEAIKIQEKRKNKAGKESGLILPVYIIEDEYDLVLDFDENGYSNIEVTIEKVNGAIYKAKSISHASIDLLREAGDSIRDGFDFVEFGSPITLILTPDPDYYFSGKNVDNDIYKKQMKFLEYVRDIDSILAMYQTHRYFSLSLSYRDEYGKCTYKLNNTQINSDRIRFKEGDTLVLEYVLTSEEHSLDTLLSVIPIIGKTVTNKIKLSASHDGALITRANFDIHIKGVD